MAPSDLTADPDDPEPSANMLAAVQRVREAQALLDDQLSPADRKLQAKGSEAETAGVADLRAALAAASEQMLTLASKKSEKVLPDPVWGSATL